MRYRQFLRVTTAITGDEESGHDAVQDGFANALRHRQTYRGEGPLEAWVWRAVVNAARRGRARPQQVLATFEFAANGAPSDEGGVRGWIAALPERQRLAIFLRYYADLDYRAIAAVLGVEIGTVSATLSAAHSALRKQMPEATG